MITFYWNELWCTISSQFWKSFLLASNYWAQDLAVQFDQVILHQVVVVMWSQATCKLTVYIKLLGTTCTNPNIHPPTSCATCTSCTSSNIPLACLPSRWLSPRNYLLPKAGSWSLQCSMFNVQCSMFNVHCTKFNVQCAMHKPCTPCSPNYPHNPCDSPSSCKF